MKGFHPAPHFIAKSKFEAVLHLRCYSRRCNNTSLRRTTERRLVFFVFVQADVVFEFLPQAARGQEQAFVFVSNPKGKIEECLKFDMTRS